MTISVKITNDEVGHETVLRVEQRNPAGRRQGRVTYIPTGKAATFHVHGNNHLVVCEHAPDAPAAAAA